MNVVPGGRAKLPQPHTKMNTIQNYNHFFTQTTRLPAWRIAGVH